MQVGKVKISAGTIARTIILALALLNQILTAFGCNVIDISDDTINTLVATAATVVTAVIAFWKNNSFTAPAVEADSYMKALKKGEKSEGGDEA